MPRCRSDAVTAPARIPSQSPTGNYEGNVTMTTTGNNARPLALEEITRLARETSGTEGNR